MLDDFFTTPFFIAELRQWLLPNLAALKLSGLCYTSLQKWIDYLDNVDIDMISEYSLSQRFSIKMAIWTTRIDRSTCKKD